MKIKRLMAIAAALIVISMPVLSQDLTLPYHYGELTAPDFITAVERSGATAIIPNKGFLQQGLDVHHGPGGPSRPMDMGPRSNCGACPSNRILTSVT